MAIIQPNSEIYLIKSPIELDNNNQLSFASASAQANYFLSLPKVALTNATFQRKDGYIRWPGSMENILNYNYCMYRNKNHGNKWFYAFITNMEYNSEQMTNVYIKTDVWQTWQFDITFKQCLVEREHTNDDTIGSNTYPENIEYGENYICNAYQFCRYTSNVSDYKLCLQVTDKLDSTFTTSLLYNRVFQGCYVIAEDYTLAGAAKMQAIISDYDAAGKGGAIVAFFVVPSRIIQWTNITFKYASAEVEAQIPVDSAEFSTLIADFEFTNYNNTIDGYQPKNNKVLCAPYNYFTVSNNGGDVVAFKFEEFASSGQSYNSNPHFKVVGALTQGGQIKCVPLNYRQGSMNDVTQWDYGVPGYQYPILSWKSDYYLNWRAKNSQYIDFQNRLFAVNTVGQIAGSIATGGEGGVDWFGNMLEYAGERWQQQHEAEIVPPTAKGNVNCGDLAFAFNADRFVFRQMCIKAEYARRVDDFLSVFGYKTMLKKVPNITGRQNWNYVKTVGCNIVGDVPQSDMQEIKGMFDRGTTIWHNASTFMDYSQTNNII